MGLEMDLATARTASAAWKASAKRHMHNYKVLKFYWQEEKRRAESAEQRVAELEAACDIAVPVVKQYKEYIESIINIRKSLKDYPNPEYLITKLCEANYSLVKMEDTLNK